MPVYSCPKGHVSTEEDFCSDCGAKMQAGKQQTIASVCPDCQSPAVSGTAVFCEVCGYNYVTGERGQIPVPSVAAESEAVPVAWNINACSDLSLKEQGSPDPPSGIGPYSFKVDKDSLLIGRHSEARGIFPDIPLNFDSAISHRHAILMRQADSTLLLRDIGSANGTRVNGLDIPSMTDVPLREGDRITLGHWTCLTVERIR